MKELYKKYLSEDYLNKILHYKLSQTETEEMLRKYNNILRIISTYIPQNIVMNKIRNPEDETHEGHYAAGTLLFVDVNGFTALTEKLSNQGYEGSEEITRILNSFFIVMINIILKFRGVLLKYGGDSMMIYFSAEDDFCGDEHAYHAVSCAAEMREKMHNYSLVETKYGTFSLHISMSVHADTFFETIVGDPAIHCEYFLSGEGVEKAAIIEGVSGVDEILMNQQTFNLIKKYVKGYSKKDEYYRIERLDIKELPPVTQSRTAIDYDNIDDILIRIDTLLPFVIKGVYEKVKLSWENLVLEGEYRPVSIVFLNFYFSKNIHNAFKDKKEKIVQSIYSEYFSMVQKNVEQYDGLINKIDMYHRGDKIIIIFGLPRSHFDDEKRALKCTSAILHDGKKFLKRKIKNVEFSIHQKIGIHSGFVFCGNIGSPLRQEYTIIGDSVNLSARVMSAAGENQILITDSILKETASIVKIKNTEKKQFKGKSEKIPVHAVDSVLKHEKVQIDFFIGREEELNLLMKRFNESQGKSGAMQIIASAGMGKTFLMREFLQNHTIDYDLIAGRGLPIGSYIQYHAVKEMLMLIFGIISRDSDEVVKEKINKLVSYLQLDHLKFSIPLIGTLLSKAYKDEPVLEIEDPIKKKELFCNTFYQIIKAKCEITPCLLFCEDGEWFDEKSIEVVDYLVKKRIPNLFIIVLSRNELSFSRGMDILHLKPFNEHEVNQFIEKYPHVDNIPEKIKKQLYEKSQGVPYFLFELLNAIRDRGLNTRLPNTIYKSILSRIDEIKEADRELLKKASIFGTTFKLYLLKKLVDDKKDIQKSIRAMIAEDYILPDGHDAYMFRNMLVQEVVYNLITVKKRKNLHLKIATILEEEGDLAQHYEILAYHFEMAEVYEKAVYYFEKSGDKAVQLNNYQNAIDYFNRAVSLMVYLKEKHAPVETETVILGKIGKVLYIEGELTKSQETFNKSKKIAKEHNLEKDIAYAELNLAGIHFQKHAYDKAEAAFKRSVKIYTGLKNYNQLGKCYVNIGLIQRAINNSESTLKNFESAIKNYQKVDNFSGIADVYNNMGNLSKELLNYDSALSSYNTAMDLYEKIDHEVGKASVLNNLGTLFNSLGKHKQAINHFRDSLAIEEKIGNETGKAVCFNNLGNAYLMLRKWDAADDYFIQALDIAREIQNSQEIANIYLNRGVMYLFKERYDNARDLIHNAVEYYSMVNDGYGLYSSFYNLGLLYQRQDQLDLSVDNFNKALNEANLLDVKIFAQASINIAQNYFSLNKVNSAIEIINKAIAACKNIPDFPLLIDLYQLAAKYSRSIENDDQAVIYLQDAQKIALHDSNEKSAAYIGIQLAMIYIETNNTESAEKELESALRIFNSTHDVIGRVFCLNKIALLHEVLEDIESANSYYNDALKLLKETGFEQQLPYIYKKIALNYMKTGKYSKAVASIQNALDIQGDEASSDNADSLLLLAEIYLKKKDHSKALQFYEKAYEHGVLLDPVIKEQVAFKIAVLYRNSGDFKNAIHYFEQCRLSDSSNIKKAADKNLTILYEKTGDAIQLKNTLTRILESEKDNNSEKIIRQCLKKI